MLLLMPMLAMAQQDRDLIRSGNKFYRQKKYSAAEVDYRKAISKNPENPQALYNLGCALMMQNKSSEAVKFYEKASSVETNKMRKAKIYHNIGVICQSGKMYGEAIKAYSEALRNNPSDNETRYNLVLCKRLQKDKRNNNNKQKKQEGKDKQEEQNGKSEKNKDKNKQKNDKQNQQQPQMSKDNAEQLINAAMQQEQQTQERMNKNRQQQSSKHLEKNW
ncbi:tetratricopeptide repeat protein [uncultured Prevotella sp.]|uniref:tetratricopeptide repeat protein n=1 Tax=uncultured Prevotella sp. TaxID=159272 RepID=UPI00261218FF|nr:tetratricopeptide repeat protein [uncultured Prevotella sp.]